ncbi:glucose/arabinose dehydrogenase [Neolewinella xylanilytica]|uniref:Glucose/arabinose dehydrogenase n=1 Tax=Neolewinella xylanilytica TaxID=1514080 RepID=A0A2S6I5V4_9BACT|nr:PQQ-dependent sugar dehydrogenase [Neolewinella xylanilytica]PPK86530.1 glucose/arabinose dehydrogenase [Neolewinella xylanilytica]
MKLFHLTPAACLFLIGCSTASEVQPLSSTDEDPINRARVEGYVFQPERIDATDARVAELSVPDGFTIGKFAEDMGKPRMLAVREDGTVYVTRRGGDIYMLRDTDGDGKADSREQVFEMKNIHGLELRGDELYMVAVNEVLKTRLQSDGTFGPIDTVATKFPEGGQHNNRTLAFGPDDKLYVSVGSTCNACAETNDENATLVQMNADGSERKIFAKGLRNTIGFDWHPETGVLYGLDHGIDWLGDDAQKEELNMLEEGKHYGWPYIYGDGHYNPADEPEEGFDAFEKKVTDPVMTYTAHSAPLDMIFYRGDQFPLTYRNDAIVTMRGSWNRSEPSGYKIVRIEFDDNGKPVAFHDFATGWLRNNDQQQMGRLVGLAEMPDGSLLATDDTNGVIYRIAYGKSSR